jgi:BolA protein
MNNTHEATIIWLRDKLEQGLSPSFLNIKDDSAKHAGHEGAKDGGGHFTVEIASPLFQDHALIVCHRMIYDLVDEAIPHRIHALKIKIQR